MTIEEALAVVQRHRLRLPAEEVPLTEAVGRRLAEAARAAFPHPLATSSSMDGFAVLSNSTPGRLTLVGESRAGDLPEEPLGPGQAMRVGTGAALPPGADGVLRLEDAEETGTRVVARVALAAGTFVRPAGSDLAAGDVLLAGDSIVAPGDVAPLAAAGCAVVRCVRRPRVGVLVTGPEVVPLGVTPPPGGVVDANGPGLAAQATAAGAEVVATHAVGDGRAETAGAVAELLGAGLDLLLIAGGSSVGPHDVVPAALADAGAERVFHGVEVRPGHPTWFGHHGDTRILGLPGNPVSGAVVFHLLGRPLLGRPDDWRRRAPLAVDWRASSPRPELVRCTWSDGALLPRPRQASYAVSSLAGARALAWFPAGGRPVRAGTAVRYSALP